MKPTYSRPEDQKLAELLAFESLTTSDFNPQDLKLLDNLQHHVVYVPNDDYAFLHEAAIIEYHGTIFASWYNCPIHELRGTTPIRGTRSHDGGKTWLPVETLGADPDGKLLYCPPVYGIVNDTLYLFMNSMAGPDLIHALELHRYNPQTQQFDFVWAKPIPFKLNANLCFLPNGRLLLPGRIAPGVDAFPNVPAVLIADDFDVEGDWRVVPITDDHYLPDGASYIHPETAVITSPDSNDIIAFCRDDERRLPLIFRSHDAGETWSAPIAHDIPFSNSKIYAGLLPDGRRYLLGNIFSKQPDRGSRDQLAIYFTKPGETLFSSGALLQDGYNPQLDLHPQFSYPFACTTDDGKLLVIYSFCALPNNQSRRGALLTTLPLA